MKYVVVIVIIILFARIDVLFEYFDKASAKFNGEPAEFDLANADLKREIISVTEDVNLKRTPKENLFMLMEDFHVAPIPETREKAMSLLRSNPGMISEKLDKELESRVFAWRDLLTNNDPELVNFIMDLMKVLRGENLDMLNRFLALWMDINMEHFITAYTRTKDTNCSIATMFGDSIPEEEKLNDYYDREDALKTFLAKENIDPAQKSLANNCFLQLGLQITKLAPPSPSVPISTAPEATP